MTYISRNSALVSTARNPKELRHAGAAPRYGFFREYLKDAEATADAWDGGWFHSGDVVRRGAVRKWINSPARYRSGASDGQTMLREP